MCGRERGERRGGGERGREEEGGRRRVVTAGADAIGGPTKDATFSFRRIRSGK